MLYISICDGDQIACQKLYILLREIENRVGVSFCIKGPFYTAASFYQFLEDGNRFDLVFLDMEITHDNNGKTGQHGTDDSIKNGWSHLSGFEFGHEMQKKFGEEMSILYLAVKGKHTLEEFRSVPLSLLHKPVKKTEVEQAVRKALYPYIHRNDRFEFVCDRVHHLIWGKDIIYFRSEKNRVEIVMLQHNYWIYRKLSEVEETLSDLIFLRVHQSYLISVNAVGEYRYKSVKMINGDAVPISKRYQKQIHSFFLKRMKWSKTEKEIR